MDCVGTPVRIGAGTIAPRIAPPHAVAPWSVGVAARDANASGVEHQQLSRDGASYIVSSTVCAVLSMYNLCYYFTLLK